MIPSKGIDSAMQMLTTNLEEHSELSWHVPILLILTDCFLLFW